MNRKRFLFLYFLGVAQLLLAQSPEEKVSTLPDARRLLAISILDNTNDVLKQQLSVTNFESAEAFSNFLKMAESAYKKQLEASKSTTEPSLDVYEQRSKWQGWISTIRSAEAINDIGGNVMMVHKQDSLGNNQIGYQLDKLRNNPRFGSVENFKQGYSLIRKNQVYGFLNIVGLETIPCQFQIANAFNDGRALVKKQEWYFIDTNGEESIALPNIKDAKALKWGFSLAKMEVGGVDKAAIITNDFDKTQQTASELYDEIVPSPNNNFLIARLDKKYGLIQIDGKIRLNSIYDLIEPMPEAGLLRIGIDKKVGIADASGSIRLPPQYDEITTANANGIAVVREHGNYLLLRISDLKISNPYRSIRSFDEKGIALVQNIQQLWGYINQDFQEVIPTTFSGLGRFNSLGLAPACKQVGQCGFIRRNGSEAIPLKYSEVGAFNAVGLIVLRETILGCHKNDKSSCEIDVVCNQNGTIILSSPENIRLQLSDSVAANKYWVVKSFAEEEKGINKEQTISYYLIDQNSQQCINQLSYEDIKNYDDVTGLFLVKKYSKWGLMDTSGKIVVKCQYKELYLMSEGLYLAKAENNKWGCIDARGKLRVNHEYDSIEPFYNGFSVVSKGVNRVGLINKYNAKVAPCLFQKIITNGTTIEIMTVNNEKILLKPNGDCSENCQLFERFLKQANEESN